MGRTRRLLSRTWRLRSWQDSHARRKPRLLRYRRPPWTSLELRPEVAEAKSLPSTRATRIPRSAASRKTDAPVMPPPMIRRSNGSPESLRNNPGRDCLLNEPKPILGLLVSPHAWRGDEHVVDPVPTGFHVRAQSVEPAVVDQHAIHLGLVVVGFVAHVPARERVGFWCEAIGHQKAILTQVLPDPAKVVEYLGLGQPARQADEQGYVVGCLHFKPPAHLAVGHVSAQKRETYSEFFCPLGKLSGQGLVGVQVGCNNLHPVHEFGHASSDGLQGTKEIIGKAARSSEDANLPSRLQARLQFGFDLPRQDLQSIIDRPVERVLQKDAVKQTVTLFVLVVDHTHHAGGVPFIEEEPS